MEYKIKSGNKWDIVAALAIIAIALLIGFLPGGFWWR